MGYSKLLALAVLIVMSFNLIGKELPTVPFVDIPKYMGTWYEIAKYPNRFQKMCAATKANYHFNETKGYVEVTNSCKENSDETKEKSATGIAFVVDKVTNSKLKVSFVPLVKYWGVFAGDYWILKLDENYQYVLIGNSSMNYLWILSRTVELPPAVLEELITYAVSLGFDRTKIERTPVWK